MSSQRPPGYCRTRSTSNVAAPAPGRDEGGSKAEAEHGSFARGEERLARALEVRERVHVDTARRVHLEVEMRIPVGITRVTAPCDLLAGGDLRAVGHCEGDVLDAAALVVVVRGQSLFRWM
jgi:hypothetical protein